MKYFLRIWMYSWMVVCIASLSGCSFPAAPNAQTLVTATFPPLPSATLKPTSTPTLEPTPAPSSTATLAPSDTPQVPTPTLQPVAATVTVAVLNVREGPGTVFAIAFKLSEGDAVTVFSQAPGGEWLRLKASDGKEGWAATSFLNLQSDLSQVALQQIDFTYVIHGRVVDQDGKPVNAINIAVYQGIGPTARRTDANTDTSGVFYAYVPEEPGARWQVGVVGIGCTSTIVDAECNYFGHFEPAVIIIDLPQVGDILTFTHVNP